MSDVYLVFEAVDASNEETYWTLGLWPTKEEAIAAFEKCASPDEFLCHEHDENDEHFIVEIRQRVLGWGSQGNTVAKLEWVKAYDTSDDTYQWKRRPTP